jgi:hypothetical protein
VVVDPLTSLLCPHAPETTARRTTQVKALILFAMLIGRSLLSGDRSLHTAATDFVDFVHTPNESQIRFIACAARIDTDEV